MKSDKLIFWLDVIIEVLSFIIFLLGLWTGKLTFCVIALLMSIKSQIAELTNVIGKKK